MSIMVVMLCALCTAPVWAHPGSGIVVDARGRVYFVQTGDPDTGFGGFIWEVDAKDKLTPVQRIGGHWLTLDAKGSFASADLTGWFREQRTPLLQRIMPSDSGPAMIQTDGCPIVINRDGNLYYASRNLEITRLSPQGKLTLLVPDMSETARRLGGIKGLASGPDGSLYVAYPRAIQKITMDGAVTTIADPVVLNDCDKDAAADEPEPSLRGLAVDSRGVIYAAATGCRCVARIAPDGRVSTVLKAERPWSPTGVATLGDDVHVLEFTDATSPKRRDWLPRVRKLERDGRVTTLATVSRDK
jgi:sugar lactone lactonase YvrE